MPQYHAAFAAVTTLVASIVLLPGRPLALVAQWVVAGAVVSGAIDLDVMAHVASATRADPGLKRWTDPGNVGRDFKGFIAALRARGLLRRAGATHVAISFQAVALAILLARGLLVPVLVGVVIHLASDLQYLRAPRAAS